MVNVYDNKPVSKHREVTKNPKVVRQFLFQGLLFIIVRIRINSFISIRRHSLMDHENEPENVIQYILTFRLVIQLLLSVESVPYVPLVCHLLQNWNDLEYFLGVFLIPDLINDSQPDYIQKSSCKSDLPSSVLHPAK